MSARYRRPSLSPAALARLDQTAAAAREYGQPAFRIAPAPADRYACEWCDCPDSDAVMGSHNAAACLGCDQGATVTVVLRAPSGLGTVYVLCGRHQKPWWELHAALFALPVDQPPPGLTTATR